MFCCALMHYEVVNSCLPTIRFALHLCRYAEMKSCPTSLLAALELRIGHRAYEMDTVTWLKIFRVIKNAEAAADLGADAFCSLESEEVRSIVEI